MAALEKLSPVLDRLQTIWEAATPDTRPGDKFRRLVGMRDPADAGELSRGFDFSELERKINAEHPQGAHVEYIFRARIYYQTEWYADESLDQLVREDATRLVALALTDSSYGAATVNVASDGEVWNPERGELDLRFRAMVIETFA